jgi:hypothetical protein
MRAEVVPVEQEVLLDERDEFRDVCRGEASAERAQGDGEESCTRAKVWFRNKLGCDIVKVYPSSRTEEDESASKTKRECSRRKRCCCSTSCAKSTLITCSRQLR